MNKIECSRLLSLPKELRLEIWTYVVTDLSMDELVLRIRRKQSGPSTSGKRFSNSLHRDSHTELPQVEASFKNPRTAPINIHLLQTNRFIYEETLPILYHSVTFHPCDLEGIFPLFLENVSPFAQSHIRYIRLSLPGSHRCFYWALTCAQVARLGDSLCRVDIEGEWPLTGGDRRKRSILFPLLKIKAPKKLVTGHDEEFQRRLQEAENDLEENAAVRRAFTAADAAEMLRQCDAERARRAEFWKKRQTLQEFGFREEPAPVLLPPAVDENTIAADLRTISGIKKFEKDLEEWDMVSIRSASPNPMKSTACLLDDETWTDAASTIVAKHEDDDDKIDSGYWELVDRLSLLSDDSGTF